MTGGGTSSICSSMTRFRWCRGLSVCRQHVDIRALRSAGTSVLATVTTVDEARSAADAGVDGLVAQGSSAGGHSGTFDARRLIIPMSTAELTRAVIAATRAAGGGRWRG